MIFTVTGPSGSGKTSLLRYLQAKHYDVQEIISCTTRSPRDKEKDGVDYHFVSADWFKSERDAGHFVEYVEFGGNFYGIHMNDLKACQPDKLYAVIVDRKGAKAVRNFETDSRCVYLQVSKKRAYDRLKRRDGYQKARKRQSIDEKEDLFDWHGYDCVLDASQPISRVAYDFMNYYIAQQYEKKIQKEEESA